MCPVKIKSIPQRRKLSLDGAVATDMQVILRDAAFVLEMTARVRNSILHGESLAFEAASSEPALCGMPSTQGS